MFNGGRVDIVDELIHKPFRRAQSFDRRCMDAAAVAALVQARHVGGNELTFGLAERRGTAQQRFVELDELDADLRIGFEDVERRCLIRQ